MNRATSRKATLLAGTIGLTLAFTGCTPESGGPTTASGGATQDKEKIDEFLLAPEDSEIFEANYGEKVEAPIQGGSMSMPYTEVLPLPEGPVGDPNKTYTICFSQALTGSTWAVAQQESAMIEAARHPNVEVKYYNTNNDPLKQVADVDTCLAQNVDAVVIWPHSVEPLTPTIEKLREAETVVVGMERTVATRDYDSWVYLDNAQATRDLAKAVGEQLGGEGLVVETDGATGSSPQILRRSGFIDALQEMYPNIEVEFTAPTDYSRASGYKVALDYLQANQDKEIDAWYDQYTEIGFGIEQALQDYGRTDIPRYSIVDGKSAVEAVEEGTFTAVAPWNPLHGDVALRAALYHLTDQEVPKNILLQQPPLITAENAAEALELTWPG